jgi:hypothetical protein
MRCSPRADIANAPTDPTRIDLDRFLDAYEPDTQFANR